MENNRVYEVYGFIAMPIHLTVKAKSKEEAITLAYLNVNRFNIISRNFKLMTPLKNHTVDIDDVDEVEWKSAYDIEEE